MRRIICATLLVSFCLQTTGAAATPMGVSSIGVAFAQTRMDIQAVAGWFIQSPMLAMVLSPQRYAAMHAPPPARVTVIKSDPTKTIHRGLVKPAPLGGGMRGTPAVMLIRPILPKDAEKLHPPAMGSTSPSRARLPLPLSSSLSNSSIVRPSSSSVVQAPTIDGLLGRVPIPVHTAASRGGQIRPMEVNAGSANPTGINPWWTYEEGALPGVGKYMVNVANGNLIVQSADVDIPERGIDLAFQRTYNSLSQNDWNGSGSNDDGSPNPSTYGTGWTNTFDAHLGHNTADGLTVFDIDGARYDYGPGTGCLTPPAGMHNSLCYDGGNGWLWTKKNGTVYHFWSPSIGGAYAGRLYRIYGRNQNNYIQFNYYWVNGDSSSTSNLTQIVAQHSDGQALTLSFGTINGKVLLSSITRPDGQQITYLYPNPQSNNAYGNLEEVDLPGNNQGTIRQQYGYWSDTGMMNWSASPRWLMSGQTEGAYTWFNYGCGGGVRLCGVQLFGYSNFTPSDGTNTPLQSNYSTSYREISYVGFTNVSGTQTNMADNDGHATDWTYDSTGRVTQTQEWTGSLWLTTNASWDSNNSLTETVDARGNATDYAYDSNGNTVAVALPAVSTNQGTLRPTSLYSYDRTNGANNIVEYCDPVFTHSIGHDWTANPGTSDSLCPNQSGATRYGWDYSDGSEPFGRMTANVSPTGYTATIAYNPSAQAGIDAGLPTSVTGSSISQLDGTTITPQQTFAYDVYGNLTSYDPGNGAWAVGYDSLNRQISTTDADSVTSRTCYFANGSIQATQTAAQYGLDGTTCGSHSISYSYDFDGDESTETHHYSGGNDVTHKWYDGEDRLIEVQTGSDATKWARYKYDLSENGTVSINGGAPFKAYGNLFATAVNGGSWPDSRGQAFDALDRNTAVYRSGAGATTSAYDTSGSTLGLLATVTDGLNEITSYTYDTAGRAVNISFQNDGGVTPARTYLFDADGRPTSITSSNGSRTYGYDAAGRLATTTQTNAGFSATTLTYDYYANGWRSALNVSGPYVSQGQLLSYAYRADGERTFEQFSYGGNSKQFHWGLTGAGRETSFADPYYTRQRTYDGYGRLATDTLQQGAYANFTYNPEGGVTGYTAFNGQRAELTYTPVNELNTEGFAPGGEGWPNGLPTGPCPSPKLCDDITGRLVSNYEFEADYTRKQDWHYDAAGRQDVETATFDWSGPCENQDLYPDMTCYIDQSAGKGTAFDAENHVLASDGATGWALQPCAPFGAASNNRNYHEATAPSPSSVPRPAQYLYYGPDGQLIKDNGEQIYWDGNQPLFTVTSGGALDDIKVDGFAVYSARPSQTQADFAVLDRDFSGAVVSEHNSTGFGGWGPGDLYETPTCGELPPGISGSSGFVGMTEKISQPRLDGIYDGTNTFQGARAYDPVTKQWTAPDAFAGDLHDPMSQKAYMWNRNNPVGYADPTGYCSDPGGSGIRICIDYYIPQRTAGPLLGDNRGTTGNSRLDSYRVRINLNLTDHSKSISVADSTWANGWSAGHGHDLGNAVTFSGASAHVHVDSSCGPCPPSHLNGLNPFTIRGDITLTADAHGNVHVAGSRSAFPALEIYQYDSRGQHRLVNGAASRNGASDLARTTSVP